MPRIAIRLLPALALIALLVFTPPAFGPGAKASPAAEPPPPAKGDRDRDDLLDDLERRLDRTPGDRDVRVIVTLSGDATAARVRELEELVGDFAVKDRFEVVDAFAATVTEQQARALAARASVLQVEEDSLVRTTNDTAQASFGVTQARRDFPSLDGDRDGNPLTYSRDDLVAAVIDSGIDAAHADLDEDKVIAFKDFVAGRTTAYDDDGHGTHVAATIAGDGDARPDNLHRGVAPAAALVGVKALDANGEGSLSTIAAAIDWVVQNRATHGIEAINLSLGSAGCSDGSDVASRAVDAAVAAGLVVAVAAGNEGSGTCTIGAPGAARTALTVGAMADLGAGGFRQASFSSRGTTLDGRIKPDISAPGVKITSAAANTGTGYSEKDGTSMATPFVAGLALLMRDVQPSLTPGEVKQKITRTAEDWGRGGSNGNPGTSGADIDYGFGRLDGYRALASAGAALTTPPAAPRHELKEGTLADTGASADFALEVSDAGQPLAVTLIHAGVTAATATSPDFDLYLYDPAGTLVAKAETIQRQEELSWAPTAPGTYTLRVRSYAGGGGFFADVAGGLARPTASQADTTPPSISSRTPAAGAKGVEPGAAVAVTFDEPMDQAATRDAYSLVRARDQARVGGAVSWSGDTLTFRPSAPLERGTQYEARLGRGARDLAGNAIAGEERWAFTTPYAVTAYPTGTSILSGSLRGGSATRLRSDDNSYYAVNSTRRSTYGTSWYARFGSVPKSLRDLRVSYKGKNSRTCRQTVMIYRFSERSWERLGARDVGTREHEFSGLRPVGTLSAYVSSTGGLRVRVVCSTRTGTFSTAADRVRITYDRP